jgi:regulatory protein
MDLLARREHSSQELRRKLSRRFPALALEQALTALAEQGLLSERRFVDSYVRQRSARGYGPLRLREELRQRGVSEALISEALASDAGWDWSALAAQLYRRRYGDTQPEDVREAAARQRFLRNRGFSGEQLRPLLGDA